MTVSLAPWVAVAERLPKDGVDVLIYLPRINRDRPELYVIARRMPIVGWWPLANYRRDDVSHWSLLPPPPNGEAAQT